MGRRAVISRGSRQASGKPGAYFFAWVLTQENLVEFQSGWYTRHNRLGSVTHTEE
jgi:hypothetical protein